MCELRAWSCTHQCYCHISNDFIRSRTKPAFRIRYSQCFRGVKKNCQENCESRGKSIWTVSGIQFGSLSLFLWEAGVSICFCVCRHIDKDRAIMHKQWFALSACRQCGLPLFTLQPCLLRLRTALVQQLCRMITNDCIKNKSSLWMA